MPLQIVERLAVKGVVNASEAVRITMRADGHVYVVTCRIEQPSPSNHHFVIVRELMPSIIPGVLPAFPPGNNDPIVAQPIDIGGQLVIYSYGKEAPLPGLIEGIEVVS